MIKQKEQQFNAGDQPDVVVSSIYLSVYEFNGVKTAKMTIKGKDLDSQLDFGKPLLTTKTEADGSIKDIFYDVRFTEDSNYKLSNKMDEGYYRITTNSLWVDDRKSSEDKYILRINNVKSATCYYKKK